MGNIVGLWRIDSSEMSEKSESTISKSSTGRPRRPVVVGTAKVFRVGSGTAGSLLEATLSFLVLFTVRGILKRWERGMRSCVSALKGS